MQPKKKKKALTPTRANVRKLLKQLSEEEVAAKFGITREEVIEIASSPAPEPEAPKENKSVPTERTLSVSDEIKAIYKAPQAREIFEKHMRMLNTTNRLKCYLLLKQFINAEYANHRKSMEPAFDHKPSVLEFLEFLGREPFPGFDEMEKEFAEVLDDPVCRELLNMYTPEEYKDDLDSYLFALNELKHRLFTEQIDNERGELLFEYFHHEEPPLKDFVIFFLGMRTIVDGAGPE